MKHFSAKIRFYADNEEEFNRYVSTRVVYWSQYSDSQETAIKRAIEDAISKEFCRVFILTDFQADHFDRLMSGWRAENKAPEMFRAMFSEEVATC
ncbi:hypothetical protein [Methanospirillum sp.]